MIAGTPHERFEVRMAGWILEARALVGVADRAFLDGYTQLDPGAQFPGGTANRLLLGATPIYEAGVVCLADASTSLGAYSMLRTVLEAWAHIHFIVTGEPEEPSGVSDSRECRAIRVDLGIAELACRTVEEADSPLVDEHQLQRAQNRVAEMEDHRQTRGCDGPPRTYRRTSKTLEFMARQDGGGLEWLTDAYSASSMVIHATGFDWAIGRGLDGGPVIVDPSPSHRAARLGHLVMAFLGMNQAALSAIDASDRFGELEDAVDHLLSTRWLTRAVEGDCD